MNIRPAKGKLLAERMYEENTTASGIMVDVVRSNVNPHTVMMKVIEDRTFNELPKDSIVICKFVGIQDMTGDEKIYWVHEEAMEATYEPTVTE